MTGCASIFTTMARTPRLTEAYWDCECPNNYIHPKSDEACTVCLAKRENQPDSHADEVVAQGFPLPFLSDVANVKKQRCCCYEWVGDNPLCPVPGHYPAHWVGGE